MALIDVLNSIRFFNSNPPWPTSSLPSPDYAAPSAAEQTRIRDAITALYAIPEAKAVLDIAAANGDLNFISTSLSSAQIEDSSSPPFKMVRINFPSVDNSHYFNDQGRIVKEDFRIFLIHEILHTTGLRDPEAFTGFLEAIDINIRAIIYFS